MSAIYLDQYSALTKLLSMAGKSQDATLLIPDLQRPYVWMPSQVVALVDSLIRGWPFGTLLTWKVGADDPARELARSFWSVVDRTEGGDGLPISAKHPPASFQMVLDGQQRVQSLLLAFGGDGWGFKLLDRQWHEHLSGIRPRGPRGKPHWSLGCLCVDVLALAAAYSKTKRANGIDYATVLQWVVTDETVGQSSLERRLNYKEPLPKASSSGPRFIRLSRVWDAAPDQASIDAYEAEDRAEKMLEEHGFSLDDRGNFRRATGALLMVLRNVKQTRVTYLELSEYEEALGSRDTYNDAVVNIFTRLNTAGRTLTREDITFAWLKIGWNAASTEGMGARACIESLRDHLASLAISLIDEDVISAISFVWSISFNGGRLLTNNDLIKGETIRPMASDISSNWNLLFEAVTRVCELAQERGLRFREHYQSVNSLAYLWAWYFSALRWRDDRQSKELEKDSLEKSLVQALHSLMDRWLLCSQWAGVWAVGSAQNIAGFAARLAQCVKQCSEASTAANVVADLTKVLEAELRSLDQQATTAVLGMNAYDRQGARAYYTPLWLWNRLDQNRWEKAQLALREERRGHTSIEVDHIVACELWELKLKEYRADLDNLGSEEGLDDRRDEEAVELALRAHEIGNCMLMEKNFNISKSKRPLKDFLEGVYEFKNGKYTIGEWASALDIQMPQVDSVGTAITELAELIARRTKTIQSDLEHFIRGTKVRVDVPA
ncbi:DUF262 domain-containing protein [Bradyrhizobium sp. SZCCHNRI1058]|uniref:DUF262 domain-containing protein n=1 Tax=Bradyrhizobium sp. SZCCHNRI1058 TaxID=3057279 RepID=UPI0029168D8F|nr:DUF262 domain-containing protein [Bradyrhizobium sp. SZCCHNRI1058]